MDWWLCLVVVVVVVVGGESSVGGENVTYDGRSLIIDGKRKLLFSGSIHYPRSTPEVIEFLLSLSLRLYLISSHVVEVWFVMVSRVTTTFGSLLSYILLGVKQKRKEERYTVHKGHRNLKTKIPLCDVCLRVVTCESRTHVIDRKINHLPLSCKTHGLVSNERTSSV